MVDAALPNLRQHPRVACVMPAVARIAGTLVTGVCRQVSRGGAFITSEALCPVGQRVRLTVELPALGRIHANAQVVYHHDHPDGRGMGVVFTDLSEDERRQLEHFIALFRAPAR